MLILWKEYSYKIEKENPRLFSILNNQNPTLESGNKIILDLRNQIQETELIKEKPALINYLKNRLSNNTIEIIAKVVTEVQNEPNEGFTASEKLNIMIQKNPALAMLMQNFNLDLY